jgi:spore coat protein CotF
MQQQNQGQQQSTGLPKVKGPEFNDRDRINDVLATVKYMTMAYNVAVNEASNDSLYQTQMNILTNLHQAQRDVYNAMSAKGWYKTDPADQQKVGQAFQQFSNYRTQFPYN